MTAYWISYAIGFAGAMVLLQIISSRTRDEDDSLACDIAANAVLAAFWPILFVTYLGAWVYGAATYKRALHARSKL